MLVCLLCSDKEVCLHMATSNEKWIDNVQFSSLFSPPPNDAQQHHAQVSSYVEMFISEQFHHDLEEAIRGRYPCNEKTLFDDVLAALVVHHPDQGSGVVVPIISCIIDGLLEYHSTNPPFPSFISLVRPDSNVDSEELVLAYGEILRILTHYNRPVYRRHTKGSSSSNEASSSSWSRPLSPWITDMLLQAPLGIRTHFFRWCGGVAGTYAPTQLKQASTGKHHVLMTSTPIWAVANGTAVILSVCDEEVARYQTATLTEAAVQAVLLPPETAPKDEHPIADLPALEPYARLFHRYYTSSSPSVTQRLLLRLLEAPPSWAPYALEAAVQLVELLRAADHQASDNKLPRNWMCLYFLHAIGIAMSMEGQIAADAAAALLFRILSQPSLLFPLQSQAGDAHHLTLPEPDKPRELPTAEEIASMLCANGLEVERRICMIWEAAYGLIPLTSSSTDLPIIVAATSLQRPILSWNLYIPLLKVLEHLPRGSPSQSSLMKIFVATVKAILSRTFPPESCKEQIQRTRNAYKTLVVCELRTIVHSLFLGSCASVELTSRLLFAVLTVCVSHEEELGGSRRRGAEEGEKLASKRGPIAAFDSYVVAAVCALSCELHTYTLISYQLDAGAKCRSIDHTRRILAVLEALMSSELSSIGTSWSYTSDDIVVTVMVAAHVYDLFRRSKACKKALSLMMRRKWDKEIRSRASSLFKLIDVQCKTVASIVDRAGSLEDWLVHGMAPPFQGKKRKMHAGCFHFGSSQPSSLLYENVAGSEALSVCEKAESNFSTVEGKMGFNCSRQALRSVLAEKQQLCFLVVSLLWHALIVSPEIHPRAESSSMQQGWRKVVDALCNVVSASPAKAAIAVVVQASSNLRLWTVEDDDHGKKARRINERVVKVIAELMNSHENIQSLMIMASSSELLLRATDGIMIDEGASTLAQLEVLEAAARAVHPMLRWGEPGLAVAEGVVDVLKCRLDATARCISHPRARVRSLSNSVLHALVHVGSRCKHSATGIVGLKDAVDKCLELEARRRVEAGLPVNFVQAIAKELSCCTISS
ncbi:protein GIGANTEA-like isoform X2 [Salvia hispanica]|uniref:protein GIGANTEA-like isoform X2 n=1 Tax=Salvia hispanica TaxID=49212 RepID=UPI00200917E7|nr:protein GIGANTEA-like isoform X2 [Salvia hispanica]